uniref:Uncharacterized protein n=1 Tax=Mycena chlorophos TaxID=658473 RepID=A0ABQ0LDW3_MYCCL|nr:predicted protein [Mycena chlorophos]
MDPEAGPSRPADHRSRQSPPHESNIPFGSYPPAVAGSMNETLSAYFKDRADAHKHKRSRSSSSVSNLLLAATERLGQETARANELEGRCSEVLSRLRSVVDEREQLRRGLAKATEELRLYKIQLEYAQKEIDRAQVIVEGVDRARLEAEEQAAKDRTIARRLASEKAVWIAREEGRNEGFKEGLRQGRKWATEMVRRGYGDDWEYDWEGNEEGEPEEYSPTTTESSSSPSMRHQQWTTQQRPAQQVPLYRPNTPARPPVEPTPSIPTMGSLPSQRPSRPSPPHSTTTGATPRPQPSEESPPRPASRGRSRPLPQQPQSRPSAAPPIPAPPPIPPTAPTNESANARPPTRMSQRSQSQARASSVGARSRRSSMVLLDGFIPTVGPGADSVISLPAPHSLSRPVSMAGDDDQDGVDDDDDGGGGMRGGYPVGYVGRATSRASTRMSDFDLLQPPRQTETPVTQRIVREWRAANPHTPEVPEQQQAPATYTSREKGKGKQTATATANDAFSLRSSSTTTGTGTASASATLPSRRGTATPGPPRRRPREIVMPVPLSATSFATVGQAQAGPSASTSQPMRPQPTPHQQPLTSAYAYSSASAVPSRPSTAGPGFGMTALPAPGPGAGLSVPPFSVGGNGNLSPPDPNRPKSAFSWIRRRLSRSFSSMSVPNIEVEPPSNSASGPSTGVVTDAALLAADDTLHAVSPEQQQQLTPDPFILPEFAQSFSRPSTADPHNGSGESASPFPPGFVPLSPISIAPGLRSTSPQPMPGSAPPPAYSLQAYTPTPPMGSSMHSEMGSASASASVRASIGSALLGQSGSGSIPVAAR